MKKVIYITEATPENFAMPHVAEEQYAEHPAPADPKPRPVASVEPEPAQATSPEPAPQPTMAQQLNQMEIQQIQFMAYTQDVKEQYLDCITW
ncbi:hypothetical protein V6N13_110545 [Hibiscus sabdariffa]